MTSRSVATLGRPPRGVRIEAPPRSAATELDPRLLSPFQRVLLATDGTLTEILEAYLGESMRVVILHQRQVETETRIADLALPRGKEVVQRQILLRGKWSHKNYLYADSILVPERLSEKLRYGVLFTQKPLGQLMIEAALETRRELLASSIHPAEALGRHFAATPATRMISRTYRIFAQRRAIMLITEKFPQSHFQHGR